MLRYRTIAAAPVRSASATWQVITGLVADTIATVRRAFPVRSRAGHVAAAPAGRMLIAGGHLDRHPLTLIAGLVHCEITTVSGTAALTTEENLNPVPGAAGAETFTIYLPSPGPAGSRGIGRRRRRAPPPVRRQPRPPRRRPTASSAPLIDLDAVRKAVTGR